MPEEPDDGSSFGEIMFGLFIALLIAPGAIWWIGTIIGVCDVTFGAAR